MLLDDDIVTDGEAEAGAFACWLALLESGLQKNITTRLCTSQKKG
jgi:hypothetical protein